MTDVAPETVIDGRYRVLERLGAGGMAEVFCAEDLQLGRRVALKLLHSRFSADPDFVERFRREAQSAAGLQHPHVVGIYDRGQWDGTWYIAMEYLPGRNLKQLIREEAPLAPARAADIVIQILKAARFAHKRGVIHRDFKPHNVIIDDEDRIKVTDFGIARAGASDMTETGSIMGTAQYLSPEQAQGHAVSARSDLYAVGVILYELLTGQVPFHADSAVSIALKHVTEPPTPPSALNPGVPPALDALVMWALEKEPERRPPDADAFLAALEHARRDASAGPTGESTAPFAPVVVAPEEPPPTAIAEPPPALEPAELLVPVERRRDWAPWLVAGLLLLLLAGGVLAYLLTRPEKVRVPRVVGEELAVAQSRVDADFQVTVIRRTSSQRKDEVIAQIPLAGEEAEKGSTITLTVSDGPGQAIVPSVAGLTKAAATRRLRRVGLKADITERSSATVRNGRVISSSPDPGSQIDKGRFVILFVSTGPVLVTVPGVVGRDRAGARDELTGGGFKVQESERESTNSDPGTVLEQSPAGGAQAVRGSTVSIVVAKQGKLEVPAVTGRDQADAVNAVTAAGFEPAIRTKTVDVPDDDGKVIEQRPAAGSKAKEGARVTLVVGRFQAEPDPGEPPPDEVTPGQTTPDAGSGAPP